MAKILCSKSGIEFKCDHFPIYLTAGEAHHPLFNLPLKRLWKYYPKWQNRELTRTDSFLYFLALLNATELVEFRCHVWQRPDTDQIIAMNMEALHSIIGKIVTIKHPKFAVPRFVISPETRDLSNVRYWIETWESAFDDFCNGLKDADLRSRLQRKSESLERLIKNPALKPERYARMLANWASEAGAFPEFPIKVQGVEMSLSSYWQEIIVKCHIDSSIISIPEKDINELLEHCEENIDGGSIQAHHLFTTIRSGIQTLQGFFSLGSPTFTILGQDDSVEKANLQMLIDSAPTEMPKRTDYPTEFAFMKAKMKYQLAISATQLNTIGDSL
jgi:hypothetical protein